MRRKEPRCITLFTIIQFRNVVRKYLSIFGNESRYQKSSLTRGSQVHRMTIKTLGAISLKVGLALLNFSSVTLRKVTSDIHQIFNYDSNRGWHHALFIPPTRSQPVANSCWPPACCCPTWRFFRNAKVEDAIERTLTACAAWFFSQLAKCSAYLKGGASATYT